jgi:outer membrane protein OmpU
MNNLKKIGLTAVAASLATVSAHAADFSVSGGASMSYTSNAIVGIGGGGNGNPWAMSDTVNFAASGELDNGWTVNYTLGLDGSKTAVGSAFEDRTLAIGMGDLGTITMMGQDGSSVVGSMDDKMPTAYEESWNFSGGPGTGTSVGVNAFKYSNSSVDGVNLEASYVPSTGAVTTGSTDIGVTYTGIDGLTIGLAAGTDETGGTTAGVDESAMYVTYAYDAFTFGVQSNESDSETAGADSDFTAYAVSYAVNDDISVSYGHSEIGREGTSTVVDSTTEASAISASYTMGSMALKGTRATVDNAGRLKNNCRREVERKKLVEPIG